MFTGVSSGTYYFASKCLQRTMLAGHYTTYIYLRPSGPPTSLKQAGEEGRFLVKNARQQAQLQLGILPAESAQLGIFPSHLTQPLQLAADNIQPRGCARIPDDMLLFNRYVVFNREALFLLLLYVILQTFFATTITVS